MSVLYDAGQGAGGNHHISNNVWKVLIEQIFGDKEGGVTIKRPTCVSYLSWSDFETNKVVSYRGVNACEAGAANLTCGAIDCAANDNAIKIVTSTCI